MAARVKLTSAEGAALVSIALDKLGADAVVPVLASALPADKVARLLQRKSTPLTIAEKMALVNAIVPLLPGSTPRQKINSVVKAIRPAFATRERYDEVMAYVVERIKLYLAGGETSAVSSAYPASGETVCGYGPVNRHWKLPDSVVVQILDRMQRKNVRAYKVECVGHAKEDVLGTSAKLEQCKRAILFAKAECAKRGIIYHATLFNDNAGKTTWNNGGPALSARLTQAKAFIDWFAVNVSQAGTEVVLVGETRTSAGKALEVYAAKVLKSAGFKIGNNNGSRPQAPASFGGVSTDFHEYHPTKTSDWPKSKAAHVTSDTGAILAQLNVGGNVYGLGNAAAIAAWRAAGVAAGYAFVIYYGFDVAEYDEAAIDAMSPGPAASAGAQDASWPEELASVTWLHANVRDWPATAKIAGAKISGGQIKFPYDKAGVWPVATSGVEKGTNANVWAIVRISGKWYAATWEWLRKGQTSKPVGCLDGSKGDHFKVAPLNAWRPKSGERFYLMVSGHARSTGRNVKERSNPVEVVWP